MLDGDAFYYWAFRWRSRVHFVPCAALYSRPTLVNEFTDFDNPYMLKRQALKRLLEERGTRNALDESMVSVSRVFCGFFAS